MENLILKADQGLKRRFDASLVKFKKTFWHAKRLGVDLNNTNEMFKSFTNDGSKFIFKVSFVSGVFKGRYYENVVVLPFLRIS